MTSRFFAVTTSPESVYGDTYSITSAASFGKIRVTGMSDSVNRNAAYEEGCDITSYTYAVGGTYKVSGTIDALYRKKSMAPLLTSLCGAAATGGYFTLTDAIKSYGFLIGDDQAAKTILYSGAGVTSMEFTFAVKEFVKVKCNWIGRQAIWNTVTSDVTNWVTDGDPTTDEPAVFYNGIIKAGGTVLKVKSATLRVDRKIDEDYYFIGSPLLQGLYMNGVTEISGSVTLGSGEYTLLQRVLTGSTTSSQITTPSTGVTQTAGTESLNELDTSSSLTFTLSDKDGTSIGVITCGNVVFNDDSHSVQGRNQWEKTVNFKCVLPTAGSFQIPA